MNVLISCRCHLPYSVAVLDCFSDMFYKDNSKSKRSFFFKKKFVLLHWRFLLRHEALCVGGVCRNCNSRSWYVPCRCERWIHLRHVIKYQGVGETSIMQKKQMAVKKTFVLLSNYRNRRNPVCKHIVFVLVHSTDIHSYILAMTRSEGCFRS